MKDPSRYEQFVDAAVEDRDLARRMLEDDPGLLEARGPLQETPLHFLAIEGYLEGVKFLLELGARPDPRNEFNNTPLMECSQLGNRELVDTLLSAGADPNAVNTERQSALHFAAEGEQWAVLELLISRGGDAQQSDIYGDTAESLKTRKSQGT